MAKFSTVISLVHSLTKAEKRYFKLFSGLQKGEKDYVALFGIIEKNNNECEVKKLFNRKCSGAVFSVALKHLYRVLTDNLLYLKMGQDKELMLQTDLLKATILFDKSLYKEGFELLQKIQKEAEAFEKYIILLAAARLELNYATSLNFQAISENDLLKKQRKIEEIIRYSRNSHQHSSLYEILRYRLAHKGNVRTSEQKKELNDLIVSEMTIMANPLASTVESSKTHLLFQAHYFITINDYKSALKAFYELIELLEEHHFLWMDSPIDYLVTIEGILDSLRTIGQFESMKYFMDKLENLPKKSSQLCVMTQRVIYIYTLSSYTDLGNYKTALKIPGRFKDSLFDKIDMLDPNKQAEVFLYTALMYFGNHDLDNAHSFLSRVLFRGTQYFKLPIFQTFRLLHLLVHYELGNNEIVFHEMRSVKRVMVSGQPKTYKVEKIIFRFLQLPRVSDKKKEKKEAEKFNIMFERVKRDKFELQVLKLFDFASWIEAKLTRKSFEQLIKDNPLAELFF